MLNGLRSGTVELEKVVVMEEEMTDASISAVVTSVTCLAETEASPHEKQ